MRIYFALILALLSVLGYSQQIKTREEFHDGERSLIYFVATDSITHDKTFGESYRLFLIKESLSMEIVLRKYLPTNLSADFPYYLNEEYYDFYDILIIKGVQSCFLFYPDELLFSVEIWPDLSGCEISDAQDTYIRNVEIKGPVESPVLKFSACQEIFEYEIEDIGLQE